MSLACPDCGCVLVLQVLTNGQHVCQCSDERCRADFMTVGRSRDQAADKFVRRCEAIGYTVALEEKLRAIAEAAINDNTPPPAPGEWLEIPAFLRRGTD